MFYTFVKENIKYDIILCKYRDAATGLEGSISTSLVVHVVRNMYILWANTTHCNTRQQYIKHKQIMVGNKCTFVHNVCYKSTFPHHKQHCVLPKSYSNLSIHASHNNSSLFVKKMCLFPFLFFILSWLKNKVMREKTHWLRPSWLSVRINQ